MKQRPLFLIGLSLALIFIIRAQVEVNQDKVRQIDNNIPEATHIEIQKQIINITAEATIPTIIHPPQMLSPIYSSRIHKTNNQNCSIQYSAPKKLYADYIKFNKHQLGKFEGWSISILHVAFSPLNSTIYALLTNGSLIKSQLKKQFTQKGNQIKNFQLFNYLNTETQAVWELNEYEIFSTEDDVYLLKQKQIFKAIFYDNNKWGMQKLQNGQNINKIHIQGGELYIVKSKTIHKISNGAISANLLAGMNLNIQQAQFLDLDIEKGYMYILCKYEGVIMIAMSKNFELAFKYLFEFHEYGYKIMVRGNTVLINFKLYRKDFIGQFFLIPSNVKSNPSSFKLNKFYYRQFSINLSFDQMQNVVLFENFGLVYSLSEINFFQHSINRNIPFSEIQTSNIYTASYPKILDVIGLEDRNLHYILVQKNGIFVESLGNSDTNGLLNSQMKCVFQKSGRYEVRVAYDGFCKVNRRPQQAYCSKEEIYVFEVNDQKQNRQLKAFNDHLFIVIILAAVFILVIGVILAYRRIALQNQQKFIILLEQKKKMELINQPKSKSCSQDQQQKLKDGAK